MRNFFKYFSENAKVSLQERSDLCTRRACNIALENEKQIKRSVRNTTETLQTTQDYNQEIYTWLLYKNQAFNLEMVFA